eukprot:Sspe_Gene.25837::Locus_10488_Transcript_1_2_Confidence_0.800_Length_2994::g.25837::m.25837
MAICVLLVCLLWSGGGRGLTVGIDKPPDGLVGGVHTFAVRVSTPLASDTVVRCDADSSAVGVYHTSPATFCEDQSPPQWYTVPGHFATTTAFATAVCSARDGRLCSPSEGCISGNETLVVVQGGVACSGSRTVLAPVSPTLSAEYPFVCCVPRKCRSTLRNEVVLPSGATVSSHRMVLRRRRRGQSVVTCRTPSGDHTTFTVTTTPERDSIVVLEGQEVDVPTLPTRITVLSRRSAQCSSDIATLSPAAAEGDVPSVIEVDWSGASTATITCESDNGRDAVTVLLHPRHPILRVDSLSPLQYRVTANASCTVIPPTPRLLLSAEGDLVTLLPYPTSFHPYTTRLRCYSPITGALTHRDLLVDSASPPSPTVTLTGPPDAPPWSRVPLQLTISGLSTPVSCRGDFALSNTTVTPKPPRPRPPLTSGAKVALHYMHTAGWLSCSPGCKLDRCAGAAFQTAEWTDEGFCASSKFVLHASRPLTHAVLPGEPRGTGETVLVGDRVLVVGESGGVVLCDGPACALETGCTTHNPPSRNDWAMCNASFTVTVAGKAVGDPVGHLDQVRLEHRQSGRWVGCYADVLQGTHTGRPCHARDFDDCPGDTSKECRRHTFRIEIEGAGEDGVESVLDTGTRMSYPRHAASFRWVGGSLLQLEGPDPTSHITLRRGDEGISIESSKVSWVQRSGLGCTEDYDTLPVPLEECQALCANITGCFGVSYPHYDGCRVHRGILSTCRREHDNTTAAPPPGPPPPRLRLALSVPDDASYLWKEYTLPTECFFSVHVFLPPRRLVYRHTQSGYCLSPSFTTTLECNSTVSSGGVSVLHGKLYVNGEAVCVNGTLCEGWREEPPPGDDVTLFGPLTLSTRGVVGFAKCVTAWDSPLPTGVWQHIAGTLSDGISELYVNRRLVARGVCDKPEMLHPSHLVLGGVQGALVVPTGHAHRALSPMEISRECGEVGVSGMQTTSIRMGYTHVELPCEGGHTVVPTGCG